MGTVGATKQQEDPGLGRLQRVTGRNLYLLQEIITSPAHRSHFCVVDLMNCERQDDFAEGQTILRDSSVRQSPREGHCTLKHAKLEECGEQRSCELEGMAGGAEGFRAPLRLHHQNMLAVSWSWAVSSIRPTSLAIGRLSPRHSGDRSLSCPRVEASAVHLPDPADLALPAPLLWPWAESLRAKASQPKAPLVGRGLSSACSVMHQHPSFSSFSLSQNHPLTGPDTFPRAQTRAGRAAGDPCPSYRPCLGPYPHT